MSLAALVLSAPIFLISFVVSSFCSEMSLKIRLVCVVDSLFARLAPNCLRSLVVGFKFSLIWEQIVHCFGGHFLFLSFIAAIFRRRWYLLLPSLAVLLVFFLHFLSDLSGNKIYVQYKKQISVTSQEELHYINSFVNSVKNGIMRGSWAAFWASHNCAQIALFKTHMLFCMTMTFWGTQSL